MSKQDFEKKTPESKFYQVSVIVMTEDMETGKVKKVKETHLVDAVSPTDVEAKVAEEMKGTMWEWSIDSMKVSKVNAVY